MYLYNNGISYVEGCSKSEAEVSAEVVAAVRSAIGPVAAFKHCLVVPKLPKTRSGKVARNTLAAMAAGKPFTVHHVCFY